MKPDVAVITYYDPAVTGKALSRLSGSATVRRVRIEPFSAPKMQKALQGSVIAIVSGERFDDRTFSALPELRLLCCDGTGTDHIDLSAATRHRVIVTNAPVVHEACADFAFGLILALVRGIVTANSSVREGLWADRARYVSSDISESILGLYGFGRVAQAVARRAAAFNIKVIGFSQHANKSAMRKSGVQLVSRNELLARSDILSVHIRLTEQNRGIVGTEEFRRMKDGAYFINTSRGALIDEDALEAALRTGKLRGAAIDVMEHEPPPVDHPLLKLKNVIITPHIGSDTRGTFAKVLNCVVDDILLYLSGNVPINVVNCEVLRHCTDLQGAAYA